MRRLPAAADATGTVAPSVSVCGAVSSHQIRPSGRRWMATGTSPASSSKTTSRGSSSGPKAPMVASTNAVPMLGCPANGTSPPGVKMRTRRSCPARGGKTNVVSE